MRRILKNGLAISFGLVVAFLLVEIILRVFQPFNFRVKGDKIVLVANQQFTMENPYISKLDKTITHTKNSLGFRGKEPPKDFEQHTTLITIGGSTTACYYLSDSCTWTARLGQKLNQSFDNIWINNAGIDGHSTFGHQVLLEDYIIKLKPNYALFLVGVNEIGTATFEEFDKQNIQALDFASAGRFIKSLGHYSETIGLGLNFYRYYLAYQKGLIHQEVDFKDTNRVEVAEEQVKELITYHQNEFLPNYKKRLEQLIKTCTNNSIQPILITQPQIIGNQIDSITQTNLATLPYQDINGSVGWQIMELYNDITRTTAQEQNINLIDLAQQMEKDSRYYYDYSHFTNEGAERVAFHLFNNLSEILDEHKTIE